MPDSADHSNNMFVERMKEVSKSVGKKRVRKSDELTACLIRVFVTLFSPPEAFSLVFLILKCLINHNVYRCLSLAYYLQI